MTAHNDRPLGEDIPGIRKLKRAETPPADLEDRIIAELRAGGHLAHVEPAVEFDGESVDVAPVVDGRRSWVGHGALRWAAIAATLVLVFGLGREVGRREVPPPIALEGADAELLMESVVTMLELERGEHIHTHVCMARGADGRRFCILEKAPSIASANAP